MKKFLLIRALRAVVEAYRKASACNQNCNQGRSCKCNKEGAQSAREV